MHLLRTKERRSPLQVVQSQVAATLGPYVQAGTRFGRSLSPTQPQLQDSSGEIHLDLSVKEGKCSSLIKSHWFCGMDGWTQTKCRNCTCTCYCYACRGVRRLRERRELIVRWCHSECMWRVLNPLIPKVSKSLVPLGIRFQIWISFLTQRLQAGTAFRKQLSTSAYCTNMGGSSGMQKVSKSAKNPGFSRLSFECLHGFRRGKNGKQMWICDSRPSRQMRRLVLWHQTSFYQRQTMFSGCINYGDWGADMPGFFEGYLTFGQARIRRACRVLDVSVFSVFGQGRRAV